VGVAVDIKIKPAPNTIKLGIVRWADSMDDWTEAWKDVAKLFRRHEARHFKTEGGSTGKEWEDLNPKYAAWKDRRYPGRPKLVLRGTLRHALTKGGPDAVEQITKKSMVVGVREGTDVARYAMAHARGGTLHGGGTLPKRPPVRYDARIQAVKELGKERRTMTFGTAVAQLIQAHVVRHRKRAFKGLPDPFNPGSRGRLRAAGKARRAAVSGRWKTS